MTCCALQHLLHISLSLIGLMYTNHMHIIRTNQFAYFLSTSFGFWATKRIVFVEKFEDDEYK